MTTPKEKAEELRATFGDRAVKVVDLILKLPSMDDGRMIVVIKEDYDYWKEVKNELNKM